MKIEPLLLKLVINDKLSPEAARKVRGYIASFFRDNPVVHHHLPDGRLLYRYPVIQYKVINNDIIIIGIYEGVEVVKKIFEKVQALVIDSTWQEVVTKSLFSYSAEFGSAPQLLPYTFLSPWLALNEQNYQHYVCAGSPQARRELLERILVGNILSVAKGLGYTVTAPLTAELENIREVRTTLKGTPMLGFLGNFRVNFEIPEFLGLGKSVSRGFGTIGRL
ncbi:MAG: CRISPR-associated endonuclease Cas6 [candidate division WOR-3 bacterium]